MDTFASLVKTGMNRCRVRPLVLGICGSPRKGGNSDVLMHHVMRGAIGAGRETAAIYLRDLGFQGCIGCERCRKDEICTGLQDGMSQLYPHIFSARGIVLVSPTHNYNLTSWMKAFIDRLYCFYDFDGRRPRGWSSRLGRQERKAVIVAVYEQLDEADMGYTLEGMRRPLQALGYEVVGELAVAGIFDRGRVGQEPEVLSRAEALGAGLARAIA